MEPRACENGGWKNIIAVVAAESYLIKPLAVIEIADSRKISVQQEPKRSVHHFGYRKSRHGLQSLEQFREKHVAAFRPELRENKERERVGDSAKH